MAAGRGPEHRCKRSTGKTPSCWTTSQMGLPTNTLRAYLRVETSCSATDFNCMSSLCLSFDSSAHTPSGLGSSAVLSSCSNLNCCFAAGAGAGAGEICAQVAPHASTAESRSTIR